MSLKCPPRNAHLLHGLAPVHVSSRAASMGLSAAWQQGHTAAWDLSVEGEVSGTLTRVRTDSSSDTDRGPIWLNLDLTRSADIDYLRFDGNPCEWQSICCPLFKYNKFSSRTYNSIFTYNTLNSIQMLFTFIINTSLS